MNIAKEYFRIIFETSTSKRMEVMIMKNKIILHGLIFSVLICLFVVGNSYGGDYEVLNGLNGIKTVFDVRTKSPKSAWTFLDLIHKTYNEKNIREVTDKPEFVVIFIGPAVKLISSKTEGFSEEDKKMIGKIATTVSAMAKDGIKLEVCLYAANLLGVDPATILPEIKQYENGWISLIGYQAKGYTLVPAY